MIVDTSLAPPLRRALATLALVAAGHAGAWRALQARPELPPAGVDRVEVVTVDGSRIVTHRATIDRILAVVRSHPGEWTPFPETVCLPDAPSAALYQGAVRHGVISWGPQVIRLQDRDGTSVRVLSPRDGAELQELLAR